MRNCSNLPPLFDREVNKTQNHWTDQVSTQSRVSYLCLSEKLHPELAWLPRSLAAKLCLASNGLVLHHLRLCRLSIVPINVYVKKGRREREREWEKEKVSKLKLELKQRRNHQVAALLPILLHHSTICSNNNILLSSLDIFERHNYFNTRYS